MRGGTLQKGLHMLVFIVVFLTSLQIVAAENTIELVNLNASDLRNAMDVSIMSCIEGAENVKHHIVCQNTFETLPLETLQYNDTCHVSYADLYDFQCIDISLQAIYEKDEKIQKLVNNVHAKQVFIEPKKILESQKWDGGWTTASNTAYAIWILSQFPDKYSRQILDGLRWLKDNRDDQTKCWAIDEFSNACSVYETSRALSFLSLAGYNDTFRIKSDGHIWLESRQNYIQSDDGWEIHLTPQADGNCTVKAGTSSIYDDAVTEDERYEIDFTPDYGLLLNFSCTMDASFAIYDNLNRNIFGYTFDEDDEYDFDFSLTETETESIDQGSKRYRMNPACWSASSKWQYCNKETTLYSLIPEIDDTQRELALTWFEKQLENDTITGRYVRTANSLFDTGLYLYAVSGKDTDLEAEVQEWLVYNQNNDGSWGEGTNDEKALPTAMAVLALQNETFVSVDEVIADARDWFSTNTPLQGWDDVKQDSVSFMILKDNARPFLKLHESAPIIIDGTTTEITLVNPTEYDANNITFEVIGDASAALSATLPERIPKYKNRTATLQPKASTAGSYTGVLLIRNTTGTPFMSVPVIVSSKAAIDLEVGKTIDFFEGTGDWYVNIKQTNVKTKCDIDWGSDQLIAPTSVDAGSRGRKDFTLSYDVVTNNFIETGKVTCATDDGIFEFPFDVEVNSFATYPLMYKEEELSITKAARDKKFRLINRLNVSVTAQLTVEGGSSLFSTDLQTVTIDPNEDIVITLINQVPEDINLTDTATIVASALGYDANLPVTIDIVYNPDPFGWIITLLIWTVFLGGLGVGGYYGYLYRSKITRESSKYYNMILPKLPPQVLKYMPGGKALLAASSDSEGGAATKTSNELGYYEDVVRIMRGLGKQDTEIRKRLAEEGLSEQRMDTILAALSKSEKIESEIRHEDQVRDMLKAVANEDGEIFKRLRDQGYGEDQIKEALQELDSSVKTKEEELKKEFEKTG